MVKKKKTGSSLAKRSSSSVKRKKNPGKKSPPEPSRRKQGEKAVAIQKESAKPLGFPVVGVGASAGGLEAIIEQLETSNEELRASNEEVMSIIEELQSTNEELETSKEELQSLNEELATVNNQLASNLDKLATKHADLENLIAVTDVATVFLDADLGLRWFTPAAQQVIRTTREGIGRHLRDFPHDFVEDDLTAVSWRVLKRLSVEEDEVACTDGRTYLRRVTPYRTVTDRIGGVVITLIDITERKEAERTRERLAAIVSTSNDAIIGMSLEGIVESWNAGAERIYGYTADEAIGQSIQLIIPPELRDEELAMRARLHRGESVHFETVRVAKDGRRLDISLTLSPIKDENGRVVGDSRIARDITVNNLAQRTTGRLAAIVSASDDAIIGISLEGIIESWNAGAERIYGYTAEEAVGRPNQIIIPSELQEEERELLVQLARGEAIRHFETVRLTKDGRALNVSLGISPIKDENGRVVGVSKVARDITDRQRAAAELKAKEEELELISKTTPLILTRCSRDFKYRFANRAAAALFGLDPEDMIGKPIVEIMGEKAFASIKPHIERVLQGERVVFEAELEYSAAGRRWVHVNYAPERDDNGVVTGWIASIVDITARKRAEIALKESEERYRAIFETAVDGVVTIDERGVIHSFNPAAERLFGYEPEEVYGCNVSMLMPEEYAKRHDTFLEHYLRTGERKIIGIGREVIGRRKDGTTFPMDLSVSESKLGEGYYIFTGLVRDITERKQAEVTLRESEERFRTVANSAPVLIWVNDADGCVFVNQPYLDFLGIDRIEGMEWMEYVHPDDRETYVSGYQRAFERREPFEDTFRFRRHDGAYRWMHSRGVPRIGEDGTFMGFTGSTVDVTDQMRAAEAVQESERRLSTLVSHLPGMAYRCRNDRDWTPEFVSVAVKDITGYDPEELYSGRVKWTEVRHPEDTDRVWEAVKKALKEAGSYDVEYRILHKDGSERWVWEQGEAVLEGGGVPSALEGFISDITERKEAEEQLRSFNEQLERKVDVRTAELNIQNRRLRWLARELSEAEQRERRELANMLHDGLQQLLVAGKHQLTSVLSGRAEETVPRLREVFDEALRISRSLTYDLSPPPMLHGSELPESLQWLAERFRNDHDFKVEVRVAEGFPALPREFKTLLFVVIRELVFNAVKYSGTQTAQVEVRRGEEGEIFVTVSDDGQGFAPEDLDESVENSHGLGLINIRERLAALGGAFHVESRKGAGVKIRVTLPFDSVGPVK